MGTPSLRQRLRMWLDPRWPWGARLSHYIALAPLVVIAVAVLVAFIAGIYVGRNGIQSYTAQYSRYVVNAPPPVSTVRVPQVGPPATRPPVSSAHVNYRWLLPPQNQGSVGQCQCFAFALQYDYLYGSINHTTGDWSCRLWYPDVTQGRDEGSYFEQYPPVLSSIGAVPRSLYDWPGEPNSDSPYPVPAWVINAATGHRYNVTIRVFQGYNPGGGQLLINRMEHAVYTGHPVNLDFPVYGGAHGMYDPRAIIDFPDAGSGLVGYHAVTGIAFYRNLTIDGITGWFLIQNQWTPQWGMGRDLQVHPASSNLDGYALMSYRFVAQNAYGVEVLHGNGTRPTAPRTATRWLQPEPYKGQTVPLPAALAHQIRPAPRLMPALGHDWIGHIIGRDTGIDLAPTINYWAHAYGLSVAGMLATIGTECGLYTTSTRCDHIAGGLDISFGDCQVTVATAAQFGIGNGIYDAYASGNGGYVRNYENWPANCHYLGSRALAYFQSVVRSNGCDIVFPSLYVAWNAGPGNPCWFLLNPSGQARTNYDNYLQWYQWALGQVVGSDPYAKPPPVFRLKVWNEYRVAHHLKLISPYYRGSLSWVASVWRSHQRLGGIVRAEHYVHARAPFRQDDFEHGHIYCWNAYHQCKITDP